MKQHQLLPFRVRGVTARGEFEQVVALRAKAYGKYSPDLGKKLEVQEAEDTQEGNVVLCAFAKDSGRAEGSLRIHTNLFRPLPLEASVTLPERLRGSRLAEATRLSKQRDAGPLVKLALFKTFYTFCSLNGIDTMIVAGRDPLYRQYEALLFEEVFPGRGFLPMKHAGGIGHKVLSLDTAEARPKWSAQGHPLLEFMVDTDHPDIEVPSLSLSARRGAPPP